MIILRILLIPFSWVYGAVIQLRNILYDMAILKAYRCPKPVISVGNITAGGTGKTPLTIHIASLLLNKGKKVAIISRGYGRKSKGFQLVSDGQQFLGRTSIHGDEAVLTALIVPKAIVAVCEKKKEAIRNILSEFQPDIFLLDDAFQHRSVYRDSDIVLLPFEKKIKNKLLIPAGVLREFAFNLKRADVLVTRNKYGPVSPASIQAEFYINPIVDMDLKISRNIEDLHTKACVAFAGIAHPLNFKNDLVKNAIEVKTFFPFKDHFMYTLGDIEILIGIAKKNQVDLLLCTEKDLVKVREIPGIEKLLEQARITIKAPRIIVKLEDESALLKKEILS